MSRVTFKLLPLLTLFALFFAIQEVHAASSQPIPIEPENRAKLARVKAAGSATARSSAGKSGDGGDGGDSCSLQIGNVDTGGRGLSRAPREVNIFVPGDIFQVNNRCR